MTETELQALAVELSALRLDVDQRLGRALALLNADAKARRRASREAEMRDGEKLRTGR